MDMVYYTCTGQARNYCNVFNKPGSMHVLCIYTHLYTQVVYINRSDYKAGKLFIEMYIFRNVHIKACTHSPASASELSPGICLQSL